MSEKKISYLNRDFSDYRSSLLEYIKTYYPDIADNFNDASIGSWMIDLAALIGDNLSYHIDSVYNETNIESAKQASSIKSIARTNGYKVPGPSGSMVELKFTVELPVADEGLNSNSDIPFPNFHYAPIIKRGTRVRSNSGEYFETINDIDFTEEFNDSGIANRDITPFTDSNSKIQYYNVSKTDLAVAGITNVYKVVLNSTNVKPFMEITIPQTNVMNVESIIVKDDNMSTIEPTTDEYYINTEFLAGDSDKGTFDSYRFFEVDSLLQQYRWGDDISTNVEGNQDNATPKTYTYSYMNESDAEVIPMMSVTRGAWIPLTQKFITEYDDNGYLKITFGPGETAGQDLSLIDDATDFSKYRISKMVRNNFLGKLPKTGMTMYIRYRVGGGAASNVAANSITTISYLNYDTADCMATQLEKNKSGQVKLSLEVTNTTPSISGKNSPSTDEVKMMMKYNNSAQERCITAKDYEVRLNQMPSRYGCAFRTAAIEENNKIMLYMLNIDNEGKLTDILPVAFVENVEDYLAHYRSMNDFVEIKPARIVNISFEADIIVNKTYNKDSVLKSIINTISDYMDISKHFIGEDIYIGDLMHEIGEIDGVINVTDLRAYNLYGGYYSDTITSQTTIDENATDGKLEIDLEDSLYILNGEADEMFEIKYPDTDIRVRMIER